MSWRRFWSPGEGPNMLYTNRRQIYSSFRIYRVAVLYPTRKREKKDIIGAVRSHRGDPIRLKFSMSSNSKTSYSIEFG